MKEPSQIVRMEYSGKPLEIKVYDYDCDIRYRCVSIEQMFSLSELRAHDEWNNIAPNQVEACTSQRTNDFEHKSEVTLCANDEKMLKMKKTAKEEKE